MKNAVSHILTTILLIFTIIIFVSIINCFITINRANAYHETCIAEIQASNFNTEVIQKYESGNELFTTKVEDVTMTDLNGKIERTGRIEQVTTTYTIKIPLIGYSKTETIVGYAR